MHPTGEDEPARKPPPESAQADMTRQGGVVASMTLLSRISGLARDIVFSYLFGASHLADMFFVAFRIPNFFRRLFAEGAFNQAFVPVLVRHKEQGHAQMLTFIAPLSGIFASALVLVVLLGVVAAPWLTYLFAPGFADDENKLVDTAELVRITFPYLGFISLTAYAGAVLNAHQRFALPAVTPVLLNLTLIAAAMVAMSGWLTLSSTVILAWGVLLAGVVQLLVQLPALRGLDALPRPSLQHQHPGVRQVGKLLIPAVLAGSVGQINALVNTMLASTLMPGSISWLYYADRLLELPIGLVAVALGTVMLPHLSRLVAVDDRPAFSATVDWGIGLGLLVGLPAGVALYCLSDALIATLFMSLPGGAMTVFDARMAGYALQMFAVALPGFVLVRVMAPAFFAHEDTQSPFRYASGAVVANLVMSLATYSWFGHVGLAWATAISAWVHVVLLYWGMQRRGLYQIGAGLWPMLWKALAGSVVMAVVLGLWVGQWPWLDMPSLTRIGLMLAVAGGGVLLYAVVLLVLGLRPTDLHHARMLNRS